MINKKQDIHASVGLSEQEFKTLHPFHLVFDAHLNIVQRGLGFDKLCSTEELEPIRKLTDIYLLERPQIDFSYQSISANIHAIFMLRCKSGMLFKGQMVPLLNREFVAFIGAPVISSMEEMLNMGLSLNDFPLYDSTRDYLLALNAQEISLKDLRAVSHELSESQALQNIIVNNLISGVLVCRVDDAALVFANDAAKIMYDLSGDDLIGKALSCCDEKLPMRQLLDERKKFTDGDSKSYKSHLQFESADASSKKYFEIEWSRFLHPTHGEVVISLHNDVTKEKNIESQLASKGRKYESLVDSAPNAIVSANSLGKIESWNSKAVEIFGFSESEAIGQDIDIIIPKEIRPQHHGKFENAVSSKEKAFRQAALESTAVTKDGKSIPVTINLSKWFDNDQIYFTAVIRDLSNEKLLEGQLRQSQKLEAVGQLAGGIAHDFNNLLTVILSVSSDLSESYHANPDIVEKSTLLADTGLRAAALTKRLLSFGRQEVIKPEIIILDEVVAEMLEMLKRVIGEQYTLNFISHKSSPIKIDKGQVGQILLNLTVNAKDAMPNGGTITFEATDCYLDQAYVDKHREAKEGPHVMLAVSDTGTGINPSVMSKIFDPFFTTKEVVRGTGLGLSMVFGAVKQNNGSIQVYSEVGHGTSFKLFFPQVAHDGVAKQQEVQAQALLPINNSAHTILLVDDEAGIRNLVSAMLRKEGFTVVEAVNGQDAIEKCQQLGTIDLLLTDIVMPTIGGVALNAKLKTMYTNLRTIFMSGFAPDAVINELIIDNNFSFLPKPFNSRDLLAMVNSVLSTP